MTALSILDLVMIGEDKSLSDALADGLQLARTAERLGACPSNPLGGDA